ncbi:hypothetical protein D3C87_1760100 [compost metagenome]
MFGRGNQQISPVVLKACPPDNLVFVATREKLMALPDGALHLDSGDAGLDARLVGYVRVRTGSVDSLMMRLQAFL